MIQLPLMRIYQINHFCLGLLSNLGDLIKSVDTRSTIFGILYPLSSSWDGIPLGVLDKFWAKPTFFSFLCYKVPRRQTVDVIQRRVLLWWTDPHVRAVWTDMTWSFSVIIWSNSWLVSWIFDAILIKVCSEPSILEVNILQCTVLWTTLHSICPIWGYCAFPHEWNCIQIIIKYHM